MLSKIYKLLLKYETETEQIKIYMEIFNKQISYETWEQLWVKNIKLTKCQMLREHWYKMC